MTTSINAKLYYVISVIFINAKLFYDMVRSSVKESSDRIIRNVRIVIATSNLA